jgi:hypothetical protein
VVLAILLVFGLVGGWLLLERYPLTSTQDGFVITPVPTWRARPGTVGTALVNGSAFASHARDDYTESGVERVEWPGAIGS